MRTQSFRPVHTFRPIKLTGQLSALALLAGLGAGCSSMIPVNEPVFTGSTSNQREVMDGGRVATAAPVYVAPARRAPRMASVEGNDLPPPPGASAYAGAPRAASAPPLIGSPQPYTPPKPDAAASLAKPAGDAAKGASKPGATLVQLGAPPSTLNEQASRMSGPAETPAASAAHGGAYTVQPGDTMYSIARRNGLSLHELVAANGGSPVARVGQRLVVPGGASARPGVQLASVNPQSMNEPQPAIAPAAPKVASAEEILPPSAPGAAAPAPAPQQLAFAPQAGVQAPAAPQASPAPSAGGGDSAFRWPVRGRVISGFGKKPNGERNDGINLAVPEGTAVKAAEDGTVIYAGSELKSYGNLVLIRHANGWVSAYAHNSELKVKRGAQVRRGEIVALSGMSGGVTTPQVHFELRHDASPVDPLQHLTES